MLTGRDFTWHCPTRIEFGYGALERLPALAGELGCRRLLLVSDPGLVAAGLVERAEGLLRGAGLAFESFTEVDQEPDHGTALKALAQARAASCDGVIGLGGGSALDGAKIVGLMLGNEGEPRDYVGLGKVPKPGVPVIAVPTTAGTGSEMTVWSVLSDKANDDKYPVGSPYNCPRIALLDPELSVSLPAAMTAATGFDALTHAMESYTNRVTQPISEAMAERAIGMIGDNLRLAVAQPDNREARGQMLLASTMAALAFNNPRLGLVHALTMPLGARFHIPHGLANGIVLPAVMRFNLRAEPVKYARVAALLGEDIEGLTAREAAALSVPAAAALKRDCGLTETLADFGVTEESLDWLAEEAMKSGNIPINPVRPSLEDVKAVARLALRPDSEIRTMP